MAVATAPSGRRSLLGMAADALAGRARRKGRKSLVAEAVREHLMTVAAFAFADFGFWHSMGTLAGCLGVFVSLLVLDFKLQG